MLATDNYKKHTSKSYLQRLLIDRFFQVLIGEVEGLKPKSVLDAGCGEGFTLKRLASRKIGKKLEGIDFSKSAIHIGKKLHPELKLSQATIYHIPYPDSSFDAVLCTEVLEHLEFPEKALQELARVTRKYCVISVPNEPWFRMANLIRGKNVTRLGNDIEHIQHWSRMGINRFAGRYLHVLAIKNPFPWTILVAEK